MYIPFIRGMETILFLCTHNSARSQIAEGLVNHYFDQMKAYSAGTEQTRVHPLAIKAMAELGIDISNHQSKTVDEFKDQEFDYVVTVCDRAKETCPYFPTSGTQLHQDFDDPSAAKGSEEERLEVFKDTRDQIYHWLNTTFTESRTTL